MVEESDIDTLAVSVGSVHGQSSRLDLSLLEEIAGVTPAPLVLHGGSHRIGRLSACRRVWRGRVALPRDRCCMSGAFFC